MKKIALHWQIIIAMALGLLVGLGLSNAGMSEFSADWIKPFGTVFLNLLKVIAVPLVLVSIIQGITSLTDMSKLSRMGMKAAVYYLCTTVLAISVGLIAVNIIQPGASFSPEKREEFKAKFSDKTTQSNKDALNLTNQSPLQPVVDMFASNIVASMTDNRNMLQVIVFAIFLAIAMLGIDPQKAAPLKQFFDSLNDVVLKMVDYIMLAAPFGVFALLASLITDFTGDDPGSAWQLLQALGMYSLTVLIGLAVIIFGMYPLLMKIFTNFSYKKFMTGMAPAQMMAFSTSSSAATLPVTMQCLEENLHVPKEIAGFVLPLGATVNMDGTSLYQAVAAVFIAQAYGLDLSLGQQLGIIVTATMASIGSAAVPGAGTVMLVIVLEQAGIPLEGIALIFAPDRLLDMCRTVANVTGDAVGAIIIHKTEKI